MAGACGNRTHLPHLSVQDNGFEVRGAHQGPMRPHEQNIIRNNIKIKCFLDWLFSQIEA